MPTFKICVVGDAGTGKTSLMQRFCEGVFTGVTTTNINSDFKEADVECEWKGKKQVVSLQIWDTAGQERFRTITSAFYHKAHAILICYDVVSPDSFDKCDEGETTTAVGNWLEEASFHTLSPVAAFVANKTDLRPTAKGRVVSLEDGQEMAKGRKVFFYETSAKENTGVDELFADIALKLLGNQPEEGSKAGADDSKVDLSKRGKKKKKGGCCIIC